MPDERSLIERARQGDREAFTRLVRHNQNRVFGFLMRMTANRDNALDLTQDTFLAAYQNLAGFRSQSSFSTWLLAIAANKAVNYMKRAGREVALPEDFDQPTRADGPDRQMEKKEDQERLLRTVAGLPPKQRAVFELRFFQQMSFDEIARIQGSSVSAAKTNFAEALVKLKKRFGKI